MIFVFNLESSAPISIVAISTSLLCMLPDFLYDKQEHIHFNVIPKGCLK